MASVVHTIAAVLMIPLIVAPLVYMVNPRRGTELLKHAVTLLAVTGFGLCLVASLIRSLADSGWLQVLFAVAIVVAYLVRESRLGRPDKASVPSGGAERTPVLPNDFDKGFK
ncbi:MAG: hypothetical protein HYX76_15955 [Acidobacteria bacterium]|nr:hypothetical protein [Acidobacteriota bacterium]